MTSVRDIINAFGQHGGVAEGAQNLVASLVNLKAGDRRRAENAEERRRAKNDRDAQLRLQKAANDLARDKFKADQKAKQIQADTEAFGGQKQSAFDAIKTLFNAAVKSEDVEAQQVHGKRLKDISMAQTVDQLQKAMKPVSVGTDDTDDTPEAPEGPSMFDSIMSGVTDFMGFGAAGDSAPAEPTGLTAEEIKRAAEVERRRKMPIVPYNEAKPGDVIQDSATGGPITKRESDIFDLGQQLSDAITAGDEAATKRLGTMLMQLGPEGQQEIRSVRNREMINRILKKY